MEKYPQLVRGVASGSECQAVIVTGPGISVIPSAVRLLHRTRFAMIVRDHPPWNRFRLLRVRRFVADWNHRTSVRDTHSPAIDHWWFFMRLLHGWLATARPTVYA